MKKFVYIGLMLSLVGCKWSEDPFKDKQQEIKDAQPPRVISKPAGLPSNAIVVDARNITEVEEASLLNLTISARNGEMSYDRPIVSLENLEEFKDAKFIESTGSFTWIPERGILEKEIQKDFYLKIRAIAKPLKGNGPYIFTDKEVTLRVKRKLSPPTVSVKLLGGDSIQVGRQSRFNVEVDDWDGDIDEETWPSVLMGPGTAKLNLAPFTHLVKVTKQPKKKWNFEYLIDLEDFAMTGLTEVAELNLQAQSRFGQKSAVRNLSFNILNLGAASTWNKTESLYEGLLFEKDFEVELHNATGDFVFKSVEGLPENAVFNCQALSAIKHDCQFSWTPPAGSKQQTLQLRTRFQHIFNGQTYSYDLIFRGKVK